MKRQNGTDGAAWWVPISYTKSTNSDFTDTKPKAWLRGQPELTLEENLADTEWIIFNIQATGTAALLQYQFSNIHKCRTSTKFKRFLACNVHFSNYHCRWLKSQKVIDVCVVMQQALKMYRAMEVRCHVLLGMFTK